jgi:LysM repeat protein
MSRKLFARMVVVLLIVGVLVSLLPLTALAAPPGPGGAPGPAAPGNCHVVKCGETLWSISQRYGTTVWAIAQANGIRDVNRIRVGQCLVIPGGGHGGHGGDGPHDGGHIYIVQPGETLSSIAWKFHMPVQELAKANHIWNYNLIYAYQKLIIR